jgi:hypothetical protein
MWRVTAVALFQLVLSCVALAQDVYTGKAFRILGIWNGGYVETSRIQLRDADPDVRRGQLIGAVDAVDVASRSLRIGPLNIDWNEKTEFKGMAKTDLKPAAVVRVTGRKLAQGRWLASSVQATVTPTWPAGQVQITGTVAAASAPIGGERQIDILGVPVRLRGAGYNRVDSLTQRQDTRRPDEPYRIDLAGRPLVITGEYTAEYRERENFGLDDNSRSNLDQEAQIEFFYRYHPYLYFFAEAKGFHEHELRRTDGDERTSDGGFKRGQTWIFFDGLAQNRIGIQLGRQNFKETREWWWDDDLDAARLYFDDGPFHVELGLAKELARESSSEDEIDPQHKGVRRAIAQASWLWASRQALELYALHQNDRSKRDIVGSTVAETTADTSDARLTWLGVRAIGQRSSDQWGSVKYWADWAIVRGRETAYEFSDLGNGRSLVDARTDRDVSGRAFDAGISWQLPVAWEPAISLGYARGSGDADPSGTDHNFRQTGLHNNKARFFGVNRFRYYGELLRPELSNLAVSTLAIGVPFFNRSSVELVHHRYRQVEAADFIRDVRVDADLTGASRDIGSEFDLVFGFRDLARWDFSLIASRFRAGDAYGAHSGERAYLWLFEATFNF